MFRRRLVARALAVLVAGFASAAVPGVTGALFSGAGAAGLRPLALAHNPTPVIPGRPLTTPAPTCGAAHPSPRPRPPVSVAPVSVAPVLTPGPPAAPGLCPLQATPSAVVVSWYNRSDTATGFIVYRLDSQGNRQVVDQVPVVTGAPAGQVYSWTDTGTGQSGQCYVVAAVGAQGDGASQTECTVRPNPSLPGVPVNDNAPVIQWSGLSSTNDGTGPLVNSQHGSADNLIWSQNKFSFFPFHCGCGVDLAFTNKTSLWKVQATGGPVVMYGEALALRVWGGGWLEYSYQTWGVSLHLVSTPVYQWYILGETTGTTLDSSEFALWNSAADDFLVQHDQAFGPDIQWLKKTLPPSSPPTTTAGGFRQVVAYNCYSEDRPLEMWVEDETTGGGWSDMGTVQPGWSDDGSCGQTAGDTWEFSPKSGHVYNIEAVDFDADGCSNDPTDGQCVPASAPNLVGNANGGVFPMPIED